jgi:hypothetical protein
MFAIFQKYCISTDLKMNEKEFTKAILDLRVKVKSKKEMHNYFSYFMDL